MIVTLRVVFVFIFAAMLAVTLWASNHVALWNMPRSVGTHPWFIATLFDTYFAFLTFWFWVAYKERSIVSRVGWLLAILMLGNFAMAAYMLRILFRLPTTAGMEDILLRK